MLNCWGVFMITPRLILPSTLPSSLAKTCGLIVCLLFSVSAVAAPSVEGFDLVSSDRTGRTTFDFTYRLRVQVDEQSYSGASFTVASSNAATKIIQGTVPLGSIDAEAFIRTSSTFTIQQDRTVPFDPTALSFKFAGTVIGVGSGASTVQIGTVTFLESTGRPIHPGSFPLQMVNPSAGASLGLRADVFGDAASVSFKLLSTANQTLAAGPMAMAPSSLGSIPRYLAAVQIPSHAFQIQVTVLDSGGGSTTWTSATVYTPAAYGIQIAPTAAEVARGAAISTQLLISSTTASGAYNISLLLPNGWVSSTGPWVVNLTSGKVSQVNTTLTVPATGKPYSRYTLTAVATPVANNSPSQSANLLFIVE
jgi:hypothetical protein